MTNRKSFYSNFLIMFNLNSVFINLLNLKFVNLFD